MTLPLLASTDAAASAVSAAVSRSTLSWLDWAVIAGYFAIVAFVGWRASKGQNTASDYFLGAYLYFSFWV